MINLKKSTTAFLTLLISVIQIFYLQLIVFAEGSSPEQEVSLDIYNGSKSIKVNEYLTHKINFETFYSIDDVEMESDNVVRTKSVAFNGQFLKKGDENPFMNWELRVTFTYDGNRAYIKNPDVEVLFLGYENDEIRWHVDTYYEVLQTDFECILSNLFAISQNKGACIKKFDPIARVNLDICCYPDGTINIIC